MSRADASRRISGASSGTGDILPRTPLHQQLPSIFEYDGVTYQCAIAGIFLRGACSIAKAEGATGLPEITKRGPVPFPALVNGTASHDVEIRVVEQTTDGIE